MGARDRAVLAEVLALIRYYSRRGWNWLDAAECMLARGRAGYSGGSRESGGQRSRDMVTVWVDHVHEQEGR